VSEYLLTIDGKEKRLRPNDVVSYYITRDGFRPVFHAVAPDPAAAPIEYLVREVIARFEPVIGSFDIFFGLLGGSENFVCLWVRDLGHHYYGPTILDAMAQAVEATRRARVAKPTGENREDGNEDEEPTPTEALAALAEQCVNHDDEAMSNPPGHE
jgi:hypothetical protein